jgi:hypothetical protein
MSLDWCGETTHDSRDQRKLESAQPFARPKLPWREILWVFTIPAFKRELLG